MHNEKIKLTSTVFATVPSISTVGLVTLNDALSPALRANAAFGIIAQVIAIERITAKILLILFIVFTAPFCS